MCAPRVTRRYSHSRQMAGIRLYICHITRGAHIDCISGRYETANIPLSNGSNIMYFCSENMVLQNPPTIYTHPVFLENRAIYAIVRKYMAQPDMPQMI